jgi:hypothetical protein
MPGHVWESLAAARRTADLGGQLTHDGAGGERSDLCDLRPAVMAARGPAMR